ncbi:UDP-N-acetyl-D-mannosaminuronic acid transferase [Variibacter gotjawalensis]|uniref:UDP-N-acetyl-D-mannosaminuronic acid transferase n=1 Tax=Variibacter gotjawalensis TaxID=1333996 RepID=A0A0S3PWY7_9BRAD|nr:WecB/TagA/CpsF family glycosyltransferase [Variibacter gotjawalensis]NIK46288.1 N-acetylglucosaminyldiphosphoundecaprenol N-acetyl-beta-D-mannosaminyltransferase [Variibacter gotjawalensis]RZS48203.1 N-acetylglucosaminyldiphosphoundecaprenol N-acetyl-beta-D-mannosaminyltransferase [Variibacter gotjawalensis]BAT60460.1 UDP-N-acetyl-D-mannosaminuronic acid transferase [Variibacter gotjawalensis]
MTSIIETRSAATVPNGHDPAVPNFKLCGIPVSAVDMNGLAASVERRLRDGRSVPGTFCVFRDAHGIVRAQSDATLREAHDAAWLVCPDGRPLFWLGRLRGQSAIRQVPGIESVETICRAGIEHGWRHYFLGGGPGVADKLAREMERRVPGLQVAGTITPPFRALTEGEKADMRAEIKASDAHIIWIGLSTPKQELFMHEHAPHLPGTVAMGVGAAFDVNIGSIPRSPRILQRLGLEWLYRLAREPRRLFRRYAEVVPQFLMLVTRDLMRARTTK